MEQYTEKYKELMQTYDYVRLQAPITLEFCEKTFSLAKAHGRDGTIAILKAMKALKPILLDVMVQSVEDITAGNERVDMLERIRAAFVDPSQPDE